MMQKSLFISDVVKNLMPLIVNVLESLDLAFTESQAKLSSIKVSDFNPIETQDMQMQKQMTLSAV